MRSRLLTCLGFVLAANLAGGDFVSVAMADSTKRPPSFEEIADIPSGSSGRSRALRQDEDLGPEIRDEGLKEASLSYGARAGLALRTWEIRQSLETKSAQLDQIYDFNQLLITAPSGLMIEPPIISEGEDALLIEEGGQTAAVAERIYNINADARIVAAARNWRAYLERDWGDIAPPPAILFPENARERKIFLENLKIGWEQGYTQADEIFQADLDRLNADFRGMIRYRVLLAQDIVSPPYTLQTDRGVTGGGREMRIGDRALQITGPSQLKTDAEEWQPVSR